MRILGIDPGSLATGYGVVDTVPGGLAHVAHGTVRPVRAESLPARLATLQRTLGEVIRLHRPDVVAVEQVFVAASARAALVLGQARGAVLAAAAGAGLSVVEYAVREIRLAVAGSGAAPKPQVQANVKRLLALERLPAPDAADALAAAICHAHAGRLRGLGLRTALRRRRRVPRFFAVRRVR
jgi:crossover junction endodeoxyribonuclease RuvC